MKKLLIITILSFVCINLPSTGFTAIYVLRAESINPYEQIWRAVCMVESSNNPNAFCIDINGKPSVGIAQVQESRLNDYNRRSGDSLTMDDMYSPDKAKKVFMYFCKDLNMKRICQKWNGGGPLTEIYYEKLTKILYNHL
jgi:hypothetical protein